MSYLPEINRKYLLDRYYKQRALFIKYLGGKCVICGGTEDLEIDHIDRTKKSFRVSQLWPVKKLPEVFKELDKCQLLCREHHIAKTIPEHKEDALKQSITHGSIYAWMKKKCQCEDCLQAKYDWQYQRNIKRRKPNGRGPYNPRLA